MKTERLALKQTKSAAVRSALKFSFGGGRLSAEYSPPHLNSLTIFQRLCNADKKI